MGWTRALAKHGLPPEAVTRLKAQEYRLGYRRQRLERSISALWGGVRPRPRVLFYPELPHTQTIVYRICAALGYSITDDPTKPFDLVLKWDRSTYAATSPLLDELARAQRVVNLRCTDISKVTVGEAFEEAFGYALTVDPLAHQGPCVEKSDVNAVHDGRIVTCPVEFPRSGSVYQRLIDNRLPDDTHVIDLRVPILGASLPFVYLRERPVERRFRSGNKRVGTAQLYDVFDQDEVRNTRRFCALLRLEYGELDILRDRADGRIYIVDANNTPYGPPSGISHQDGERVIRLLSAAFAAEFMQPDEASAPR